ncbi:uncharacterized protein LOC114541494 [Dendronephthya gigantea]|uniref:uncharacterized protein LOC114541494 n=1 Tax=Dendronephthya gigantea TaxID=151771 RepID=UPI00106B1CB3|nr:uncharacterized protein LOC114541494 [Dendronephthya gigantea]
MFCSGCGKAIYEENKFCANCGIEIKNANRAGIKSFKEYRELKGKEWKKRVTKDQTPTAKKKREEKDVVINIGFMEWSEKEQELKRKRGKRLPLRVSPTLSYWPLLKEAETKWKNFNSNLYQPEEVYLLLYEDERNAILLPGSNENFSLKRYREEIGKDYKNITFYLCSSSDFDQADPVFGDASCSNPSSTVDSKDGSDDLATAGNQPNKQENHVEYEPTSKHRRSESFVNENANPAESQEQLHESEQIVLDEELAREMQKFEEESVLQEDISFETEKLIVDSFSVISTISQAVDRSEQSFIVRRRGVPLQRTLAIWKREVKKNPLFLKRLLRVHFSGEQGIDSGAIAREFYSITLPEIGLKMFPNGSPIDSTSNVENESFVTCGQIVATSLSQGGPAPNFLHDSVYNLMVNPNVCMSDLDANKHLTSADKNLLTAVRSDVSLHQETILEHGYTGVVNQDHIEEIVKSIIISIVMKRVVYLKEFMRGLGVYGLAEVVTKYPEICKSLFVLDSKDNDIVDANYLFSLMIPQYSPEGSSKRITEETIMDNFQDFLFKLEDEDITVSFEESVSFDADVNNESVATFTKPDFTPSGVMGWLTGQRHKPLNGESITISV